MKYLHPKKIQFRIPITEDFTLIQQLLMVSNLPFSDIDPANQHFMIAEYDGEMIGCVGFEAYGQDGLFRSLAVNPDYRNLGIGKLLTDKMMELARGRGILKFYLLTTTAEAFFTKHGWNVTDRDHVPVAISNTTEFKSICPSTATTMMYYL